MYMYMYVMYICVFHPLFGLEKFPRLHGCTERNRLRDSTLFKDPVHGVELRKAVGDEALDLGKEK